MIDPLRWPPRDPYDTLKQSWEREAASSNAVPKSRYPPYHPAYSALDAEDDEDGDRYNDIQRELNDSTSEEDGDDDVPLAQLRHRSVRLRRGSEGLEVRPRGMGLGYIDENTTHSSDEEDMLLESGAIARNSDWEELYDKRREVSLYDSGSEDD